MRLHRMRLDVPASSQVWIELMLLHGTLTSWSSTCSRNVSLDSRRVPRRMPLTYRRSNTAAQAAPTTVDITASAVLPTLHAAIPQRIAPAPPSARPAYRTTSTAREYVMSSAGGSSAQRNAVSERGVRE